MEIEIQTTDKLKKTFTIKLLNKEIEEKEQKKFNDLSKSLNLKGFRRGAIPATIIKSHFGNKIYDEILNSILYESFTDFIKKENINIIEHSIAEPIIKKNDHCVSLTLIFEIFPNIEINFTNIKIKQYDVEITETDVQTELAKLRLSHGKWQNVLSETELGDKITIDLYEIINKNKQYIYNNTEINTHETNFQIHNLKDVLIKKQPDKKYFFMLKKNSLELTDATEEHIVLQIKHIKRCYPAEIDNDFFSAIGFVDHNKNHINDFVMTKLIKTKDYILNILTQNAVLKELREKHIFDVPVCMLNQKSETNNEIEPADSMINKIKTQLILTEIKKKYNIIISKNELDEKTTFLDDKYLNNEMYKKNIIKHIENDLYMKKILKTIIEKITLIDEKITFDMLVKKGEQL